MHEELQLVVCGVKHGSMLVLEPGPAPRSSEVTLNFACNDLEASVEVMVDIGVKVKECITIAVNRLGVHGDEWHLRKTNWCGEAAKILDDLDMTLAQSEVRDGELLLLHKGKLPPKVGSFFCI